MNFFENLVSEKFQILIFFLKLHFLNLWYFHGDFSKFHKNSF